MGYAKAVESEISGNRRDSTPLPTASKQIRIEWHPRRSNSTTDRQTTSSPSAPVSTQLLWLEHAGAASEVFSPKGDEARKGPITPFLLQIASRDALPGHSWRVRGEPSLAENTPQNRLQTTSCTNRNSERQRHLTGLTAPSATFDSNPSNDRPDLATIRRFSRRKTNRMDRIFEWLSEPSHSKRSGASEDYFSSGLLKYSTLEGTVIPPETIA